MFVTKYILLANFIVIRKENYSVICPTIFNDFIFKVTGVANLAGFVSKLQNERLALIFANSFSVKKFINKGGKR